MIKDPAFDMFILTKKLFIAMQQILQSSKIKT